MKNCKNLIELSKSLKIKESYLREKTEDFFKNFAEETRKIDSSINRIKLIEVDEDYRKSITLAFDFGEKKLIKLINYDSGETEFNGNIEFSEISISEIYKIVSSLPTKINQYCEKIENKINECDKNIEELNSFIKNLEI